jgi:transposase-like protein
VLDKFTLYDFKVLTWYFYIINTLNVIDFDFFLPPIKIKSEVYFTICCKRIKTIQEQKFSHINIGFDLLRDLYICDKSNKKISLNNLDDLGFSESDKQRKTNRKQQKDFNSIPCKDNPVFRIHLNGFILIYGKTNRYVHCPKCNAFHKFDRSGYFRDEYMCPTCKFNYEQENLYTTCHVCNAPNPEKDKVIVEPLDINGIMNVYQHVYVCRKHFN